MVFKHSNILECNTFIVRCPTYQHLRVEKNLSDDKDLVNYFRKVIDIREKLEDKRNNVEMEEVGHNYRLHRHIPSFGAHSDRQISYVLFVCCDGV